MSYEITDEELQELLARRRAMYEELMRRKKEQEEMERQRILRETILRSILTEEARERLERLRLVRPELVQAIENQLIILAQSGKITSKITDEQLKMMLKRIMRSRRKEESKIIFKRK